MKLTIFTLVLAGLAAPGFAADPPAASGNAPPPTDEKDSPCCSDCKNVYQDCYKKCVGDKTMPLQCQWQCAAAAVSVSPVHQCELS